MNRLDNIQNWPELARVSGWHTAALAEKCGVSVRTLERHFSETMGKCPHAWLLEQRQRQAIELLRDGRSVKETAITLGYKHPTHFSREFKKLWGYSPSTHPKSLLLE